MKSVVLSVFIFSCYVSTALAALALGPAQVHPSHPHHCYQESKNAFYKDGESWTEEGCMEASCVMLNHTGVPRLMISYATCGAVGVDPPCYLTEDKAASYPDCCPEPVCPDSTEQSQETPTPTKETKKDKIVEKQQPNTHENINEFENELPEDHSRSNEYFRTYPWNDDYLYNDQDHMDNNVDDLQYLDYYPNERSPSPKFTLHDFNIRNFRWF